MGLPAALSKSFRMVVYSLVMNKLKPALKDECTYLAALSFQQTSSPPADWFLLVVLQFKWLHVLTCLMLSSALEQKAIRDVSGHGLSFFLSLHHSRMQHYFYCSHLQFISVFMGASSTSTYWEAQTVYKKRLPSGGSSSPWQCGHLVVTCAVFGLRDEWCLIKQKHIHHLLS